MGNSGTGSRMGVLPGPFGEYREWPIVGTAPNKRSKAIPI
jgi:hypothetical protein